MSAGPRAAPQRQPGAVLFDLDGTLLDSLGSVADALVETLAARGHRVTHRAVFDALGPSFVETIAALTGLSLEKAETLADDYRGIYYDRYYDGVHPLPGAEALLAALGAAGSPLALVTSRRERYAHLMLARHSWAGYFPVVVGHDTAAAPKPDPAPVVYALRGLGAGGASAAFVGDTGEDMASARAAGVGTVVGLTHIRSPGELGASGATHLAPDLAAVGTLLGVPLAVPRGAA